LDDGIGHETSSEVRLIETSRVTDGTARSIA
jgi:hypothetical protein